MVVISCAFPGCEYKSEDVTEAIACALLLSHAFTYAAAPTAHQPMGPIFSHKRQGPNWRDLTLILASQWKSGTYSLAGNVYSKRAPG